MLVERGKVFTTKSLDKMEVKYICCSFTLVIMLLPVETLMGVQ